MPRLKLRINIGIPDIRRLGLTVGHEGDIANVSDEAADYMVKHGWAEPETVKPEPTKAAPSGGPVVDLKTVPPVDLKADDTDNDPDADLDDSDADLEEMTKEELKAYADEYGIAGVTMAMAKADMVKAIRAAIEG